VPCAALEQTANEIQCGAGTFEHIRIDRSGASGDDTIHGILPHWIWRKATMKLNIRTIQILIVVATGPMWAITAGAKTGCMQPIVGIWSVLVFIPVGLMGVAWRLSGSEPLREQLVALLAAIAIVGYLIALFVSLLVIGVHQPIGL
jgi:hypothetical protein